MYLPSSAALLCGNELDAVDRTATHSRRSVHGSAMHSSSATTRNKNPKEYTFTSTSVNKGRVRAVHQKACDRCRRRKTRCSAASTCAQCARASACCTYLLPAHRPGRTPKRRSQRQDAPIHLTEQHGPSVVVEDDLKLGRGLGFGGDYGLHLPEASQILGAGFDGSQEAARRPMESLERPVLARSEEQEDIGGLGNSPWPGGSSEGASAASERLEGMVEQVSSSERMLSKSDSRYQ
jgi:hypothetical protein